MDIEIKTWLYDILNAINEIESFFIDSPKDLSLTKMILEQEERLNEISKLLGKH